MAEKKRTYKGTISFDSGKGNTLSMTFLEVKNTIKEIAVQNTEGKEIKYGTKINSAEEYTYHVTTFGRTPTDEDLTNVKWAFWLNKTQEKLSEKYFLIEETSEKEDEKEDFLLKSTNEDEAKQKEENYDAVKKNGILSAKLETIEVDIDGKKTKTAVLKVKFSRWLDGEKIRMEAYFNEKKLKLNSSHKFVASRVVQAKPEILDVYWTTKDGERIEKTGYGEEIYMHVVSLGLHDKTIDGLLLEKDHDTETSMSPKGDRIEWKNNQFKIEERDFKRQFKIGTKEQYKDAREEDVASNDSFNVSVNNDEERKEENEELELFFEVNNASKLELDESKKYGSLIITPQNNIVDAYFAKVENEKMVLDAPMQTLKNKAKENKKGKESQHEKLTEGVIGQKIKLVAECDNINDKEVVFQLFEKEPLLTTKDTALKVVQGGKEVDEIIAKVEDGYAIVEIELSKYDSATYKDWDSKLDPDTGDEKTSTIYIKAKEKEGGTAKSFLEKEEFKLVPAITLYEIYFNNKISKTTRPNSKKGKYVYYDTLGDTHNIGKFEFENVKNNHGSFYGGKTVNLIDFRKVNNYSKGSVKFSITLNTSRYYMNEMTLASLLGAMLKCGYEDFTFNGFSDHLGRSTGGSSTHKNGFNGDLRYFRKDKTGGRLYLNLDKKNSKEDIEGWKGLDEERQNKFNNALYDYGWKSLVSQKYGEKKDKLLKHCKEDKKHKKHYDHIHLQSYDKKFIKEKK